MPLAPERLGLIARDPIARADLFDELRAADVEVPDQPGADPVELFGEVRLAEGRLARWLGEVTELGRAPDEMEHVATVQGPPTAPGALHVFRFRMRSPHWSAARGWMIGIGGARTASCYVAEDECDTAQHVTTVLSALADWPDRRADGAA